MSIYATLWSLKFPRHRDVHSGYEWIKVTAQMMPPHIDSPTPGLGYDNGDPYAKFLPPAVATDENGEAEFLRAVVIITEETEQGTVRHPQEYSNPLLMLDGQQYATMTFTELLDRICAALRGDRPRLVIESISPDGQHWIHFEDGTSSNWRAGKVLLLNTTIQSSSPNRAVASFLYNYYLLGCSLAI